MLLCKYSMQLCLSVYLYIYYLFAFQDIMLVMKTPREPKLQISEEMTVHTHIFSSGFSGIFVSS